MSKPVVTYFDMAGRGEATRLAFTVGGIDFEDRRIPVAEWAALKAKTACGTLPFLTDGALTVNQSLPMLIYAGRQAKLMPSAPAEEANVLDILSILESAIVPYAAMVLASLGPDEENKKLTTAAVVAQVPAKLAVIESLIAKNVSAKGWVVGSSITVADIQLYTHTNSFKVPLKDTDFNAKYPNIMKVHANVAKNAKVAAWNKAHGQ